MWFGVTAEARNGERRRKWEGRQRRNSRRSRFVLPDGGQRHPPPLLPSYAQLLLLLLEAQQGDVHVARWMLVLEDGNQFGSGVYRGRKRREDRGKGGGGGEG